MNKKEYRLLLYSPKDGFLLTKEEYSGKTEVEGKMVDSYKDVPIADARSEELKKRAQFGDLIMGIETESVEVNFSTISDDRAKRVTVSKVFKYAEKIED